MRTIVVQGGWRAWALLIVGGALLLVLGVLFGVVVLGLLAVVTVVVLAERALRALGLGGRRPVTPSSATRREPGGASVIEGEYQVVPRPLDERRIPEPRR